VKYVFRGHGRLDEILFLGSDVFCHLQSPFVSLYAIIFPLQCLKL
jgi:hypothetical protein